jgi:hypothetical protein
MTLRLNNSEAIKRDPNFPREENLPERPAAAAQNPTILRKSAAILRGDARELGRIDPSADCP